MKISGRKSTVYSVLNNIIGGRVSRELIYGSLTIRVMVSNTINKGNHTPNVLDCILFEVQILLNKISARHFHEDCTLAPYLRKRVI